MHRIKRVQAGEIQDYTYIVKKYQHQIFVYCWRLLGNEQEAEDAVQDILVKAFEKINMYKPTVSFSSWLYKMAYHHCLNLIHRKKLQQKFKVGLFTQNMTTDSAAQVIESQLFSEKLFMKKLNWKKADFTLARYAKGKDYVNISVGRVNPDSKLTVIQNDQDSAEKLTIKGTEAFYIKSGKTNQPTNTRKNWLGWKDDNNHLLYEINDNKDSKLSKQDLVKIAEDVLTAH
ncbi:RNA polymerase sigma factor [Paenibacillus durus]|uniref:RNA polymerase sigma factor n=1 Tax=Paenibacillus durus TaxID=44251 RepID=UPI0009DF3302|nr:sigma-70 family RNA polymerase sigma factor [Paenibacillus durus]